MLDELLFYVMQDGLFVLRLCDKFYIFKDGITITSPRHCTVPKAHKSPELVLPRYGGNVLVLHSLDDNTFSRNNLSLKMKDE